MLELAERLDLDGAPGLVGLEDDADDLLGQLLGHVEGGAVVLRARVERLTEGARGGRACV